MGSAPFRADNVGRILTEVSDGSDFPALSDCIYEVMRKVEEGASVQHMTNVILKDFSMTLRVLRTANSAYYNRSGRPILSISHAMAMLGVDAVRDLAGSLILFEHFQRKSPGLKELVLLSLLSANHAREIAERVAYPRREEAYLCGMFRNLGELVTAGYRQRDYTEVLRRIRQEHLSDRQACLQVLGFSYEELGGAVAAHWKLPESVQDSLAGELPRLTQRRYTEAEMLRVVASFGHRLTTAIYRRETRAARASVDLLLDNFGLILGLRHDDIRQIADAALQETRETFAVAKVPLDDLRFQKQSEAVLAIVEEPDGAEAAREARRPEHVLVELAAEAEARLDVQTEFDLNEFVFLLMEAICRGGPFDRVLLALVDIPAAEVRGKIGLGVDVDQALASFVFSTTVQTDPLAAALREKQDVYVASAREERYRSSDLVKRLGAICFGLLPVIVDGVVIGCLYFDRMPVTEERTERGGVLSEVGNTAAAFRCARATEERTERGGVLSEAGNTAAAFRCARVTEERAQRPLNVASLAILKKLRDLLALAIRRMTGRDGLLGLGPRPVEQLLRRKTQID